MQVASANPAIQSPAQNAAAAVVRVLSGNLAAIPLGLALQATVTRASPGQATIVVNGQTLTVRTSSPLQLGNVLLVRANPSNASAPSLLEVVSAPTSPANASAQSTRPATSEAPVESDAPATSTTSPPATPSTGSQSPAAIAQSPQQLALVNVLGVLPDGRVRVEIDGQEGIASTAVELTVGEKYVLQVQETSAGLSLDTATESPELPAAIAATILRVSSPADLGPALKALLSELGALEDGASAGESSPLLQAAAYVRDTVRSFLPADARPLSASEMQTLVADGGLHFEAKLARILGESDPNPPGNNGAPSTNNGATAQPGESRSPDLKEALLRLLQAAQEIGTELQLPAARSALDGIEVQQAANVFAQEQQTPYILQIPFPDGEDWRTLHLAIEPEGKRQPGSSASQGFRMLMHVPLTDLGDTWIDATLSGQQFRAVLYLSNARVREQVRAELADLRSELQGEGFREVLLDVRSASDLPAQRRQQAASMRLGRSGSASVLDVRA